MLLGALVGPEARLRLCSSIYNSAQSIRQCAYRFTSTSTPRYMSYLSTPDFTTMCKFYLDPPQRHFALQATLRVAWPQMTATIIVRFLASIMEYGQELIFVYLLSTLSAGSNSGLFAFTLLLVLWIASHCSDGSVQCTSAKQAAFNAIKNVFPRAKVASPSFGNQLRFSPYIHAKLCWP
ncbi:hypothetical protein BX667DRAFT_496188 [Coemansia mojavensis]|nr:hypothetical protein BX667DRAFT_503136 [Coemansia mojavensis]KAI9479472.1 hypothetical protein BX667DRAFT_496188 [Coemansia mojavensis]